MDMGEVDDEALRRISHESLSWRVNVSDYPDDSDLEDEPEEEEREAEPLDRTTPTQDTKPGSKGKEQAKESPKSKQKGKEPEVKPRQDTSDSESGSVSGEVRIISLHSPLLRASILKWRACRRSSRTTSPSMTFSLLKKPVQVLPVAARTPPNPSRRPNPRKRQARPKQLLRRHRLLVSVMTLPNPAVTKTKKLINLPSLRPALEVAPFLP